MQDFSFVGLVVDFNTVMEFWLQVYMKIHGSQCSCELKGGSQTPHNVYTYVCLCTFIWFKVFGKRLK